MRNFPDSWHPVPITYKHEACIRIIRKQRVTLREAFVTEDGVSCCAVRSYGSLSTICQTLRMTTRMMTRHSIPIAQKNEPYIGIIR